MCQLKVGKYYFRTYISVLIIPIGFDFAKLTAQWPSEKASLLSFKANLRKNEFDIAKIKVWELKGKKWDDAFDIFVELLGVEKKASYQIASSPHPIQMLKEISQNFPSLMHVLSRENIPKGKIDS